MWNQYDGKTVAIIGNACRVKQFRPEIDAFDHQVRFNRGYELSDRLGHSVGHRTTTLVIATSKRRTIPEAVCRSMASILWIDSAFPGMAQYRPRWIDEHPNCHMLDSREYDTIKDEVDVRKPSSGVMFFCLLMRYSNPARVNVYNFDWWDGPTYHWGNAMFAHPHDGSKERAYFEKMAKTYNVEIEANNGHV